MIALGSGDDRILLRGALLRVPAALMGLLQRKTRCDFYREMYLNVLELGLVPDGAFLHRQALRSVPAALTSLLQG